MRIRSAFVVTSIVFTVALTAFPASAAVALETKAGATFVALSATNVALVNPAVGAAPVATSVAPAATTVIQAPARVPGKARRAAVASPLGRYVVTLRPESLGGGLPQVTQMLANAFSISVGHVYGSVLQGFSGVMPANRAAALALDPRVASVTPDVKVHATTTQSSPQWGLDRIDQHNLPLSSSYSYTQTGAGVHAYVVDTGIWITHNEFGGRASVGVDEVGDGQNGIDCNGHGTHVSGIIGGTTYGVAKGVNLHAVRVLDCTGSGYSSDVIAGLNWVGVNAIKPAVVNMSLGGGFDSATNAAVASLVNSKGISVAVAAGNSNANACSYSPSSEPSAITTGSTTSSDARSSFSNIGSCVDVFAPGSSIKSSVSGSDTATDTYSGTSMASPHVAGAVALFLEANPSATVAQVLSNVTGTATSGVLTSVGSGSPNLLLFTGGGTGGGNVPPIANFSFVCTGLTCTFTDTSTDDVAVASWAWNFGDGTSSTTKNPSKTYGTTGTKTVSLQVTDGGGLTASISKSVMVSQPITLSAVAQLINQKWYGKLTWSGAMGVNIDIYRNGAKIATIYNSGSYSNALPSTGTYTYKVCQQNSTSKCSNDATITAGGPPPPPPPPVQPVANFTFSCANLSCSFTDTSTGGSITVWAWDFDDSTTSTVANPSKTFASAGTYFVSLQVTNSAGTDLVSKSVTVTAPPPPPPPGSITLTGSSHTSGGLYYADLTWTGATGSSVDLYRNGVLVIKPQNSGSYSMKLPGTGSWTFKVCNLGSKTDCSNAVTITV